MANSTGHHQITDYCELGNSSSRVYRWYSLRLSLENVPCGVNTQVQNSLVFISARRGGLSCTRKIKLVVRFSGKFVNFYYQFFALSLTAFILKRQNIVPNSLSFFPNIIQGDNRSRCTLHFVRHHMVDGMAK